MCKEAQLKNTQTVYFYCTLIYLYTELIKSFRFQAMGRKALLSCSNKNVAASVC